MMEILHEQPIHEKGGTANITHQHDQTGRDAVLK